MFCQIAFGIISPTDERTRSFSIETIDADSRVKEAGITVEDATFIYYPEKNVEDLERARSLFLRISCNIFFKSIAWSFKARTGVSWCLCL